ncbi:MFS transporter [Streptomyces sp. NPDC059009]|uniref:MFS transporter n=1 Tax=Streptomyces sp. NPDC059009 TaxID=3346694 RepID=UPI0036806850
MTTTAGDTAQESPVQPRSPGSVPVVRRLALMTFLNAFGNGLFFPLGVLYFTRIVGLDATSVGLGMTVAGVVGVAAGVPAGRAADRWGSRRVGSLLWAGCGVATTAYIFVASYTTFLVSVICVTGLLQAGRGVLGAIYADVLPSANRTEARGFLRMITNVAMGLGGACGAIALQLDTRGAYVTVILINVLSFAAPALMIRTLPVAAHRRDLAADAGADAVTGTTAEAANRWRAVRDLPYLGVTCLYAVLVMQYTLLEVGLPLWILERTDAPRWTAALLLIVNCVLVALLQVRASRAAATVPAAVRAMRRSGLLLAVSCAAFALTQGLDPVGAVAVLVVGAVIQVVSEVLMAAGGWTLGYELADARAHGVYQGVFNSGQAVGMMAGPALVTLTAVRHGAVGWAVLAVLFTAAGLAVRPTVRWAQRDGAWRGETAA